MAFAKKVGRKPLTKVSKAAVQPTAATTATTSAVKIKKPRRRGRRKGSKALREICRYQKTTELLMGKAQFQRLVREITCKFFKAPRFQAGVIASLQEISEATLVRLFRTSNTCAKHAKRTMIVKADLSFACGILQKAA